MAADDEETSVLQVPVVDIAKLVALKNDSDLNAALHSPDGSLSDIVDAIRAAASEWGFFYIKNHGIASEEIETLRLKTREFFALPKDVKNTIRRDAHSTHLGYFDSELTKNKPDWKEVFDFAGRFREADSLVDTSSIPEQLRSTNIWLPEDALPDFKRTMRNYYDTTEQIARRLLKVFAVALGETPDFFDPFFNHGNEESRSSNSSFIRLNHYPVAPEPETTMGVYHHTDGAALTVLLQDDNVATLQVFHREQQQWVFVPPIKDTFVINIGDTTQVWSNDKFIAPSHRVLATNTADRYSVPFFYQPLYGVDIEPVIVDTKEKPKYRRHNYGDFLLERSTGDYGEEHLSHYRINKDD